jgi:hypothetical protein
MTDSTGPLQGYSQLPMDEVETFSLKEQRLKIATTVLSAFICAAGLIWAGASHNTDLHFHSFQPLHLAAIGAILSTISVHRMGKVHKYAGTALVTTLLAFMTLFGIAAAVSHLTSLDGLTYGFTIATGSMGVGILGELLYDWKKHQETKPRSTYVRHEK